MLGWINALEAYQKTGTDFPINIKFCLEGMEESGSVMLEETVRARKNSKIKKNYYFALFLIRSLVLCDRSHNCF